MAVRQLVFPLQMKKTTKFISKAKENLETVLLKSTTLSAACRCGIKERPFLGSQLIQVTTPIWLFLETQNLWTNPSYTWLLNSPFHSLSNATHCHNAHPVGRALVKEPSDVPVRSQTNPLQEVQYWRHSNHWSGPYGEGYKREDDDPKEGTHSPLKRVQGCLQLR